MEMNTEPSYPHEQKNYSQNAAVVFHRGFFMSRDIQDSPMILNFQTATIIGHRHDTYLKQRTPHTWLAVLRRNFSAHFPFPATDLFVDGTWKGRSGEFLNFGHSSQNMVSSANVAQQFVFLPQACQEHVRTQTTVDYN